MNPAPTPRDPSSGTIKAILAVLVLAGLIAMASSGDPVWAPPRVGWVSRWAILFGLTALWIPGLVVAGAVVLIAHRNLPSRESGTSGLRKTALRAVAPATVILTIISLLAITSTELDRGPPENEGVAPAPPPPP